MKKNFNKQWQFTILDDSCSANLAEHESLSEGQENCESVSLPHAVRIEPLVVNDMWQGLCRYQKTFRLPRDYEGKKIFIEFEGVMTTAGIWLNNKKVAKHSGGYLPFTADISETASFADDNIIDIKVDNRDDVDVPPGKPLKKLDFCWYGGIYRNVNLIVKERLYITDPILADRTAGGGILVAYPEVATELAVVRISTHVKNDHSETCRFTVVNSIVDDDGKVVAETESNSVTLAAGGETTVVNTLNVESPRLWSPRNPNLHHLTTNVVVDGVTMDSQVDIIGIRRIHLSSKGCFINGEKMYLRGTNRHQEYPFIGYALSDNAQYRDARIIKEGGFDLVRLSHFPQSPAFLSACDELGIVVINAIPGWQFFRPGPFAEATLRNIREMIRRDRNHPSVILWEATLNETYDLPEEFLRKSHEIVHQELPGDQTYSCGWIDKYFDVFIPARQHIDGPEFWNEWSNGDKAILTAEYGDFEYLFHDYTRSNFEQTKARRKKLVDSSRQPRDAGEAGLLQQVFNFQESHNQNRACASMIGDANWVFADYNRGSDEALCESGVVDILRLPKFAYHFFRSQRDHDRISSDFDSGPMVFIASYWSEKSVEGITVFSNCKEVELEINGRHIARNAPDSDDKSSNLPHPSFTFENVAYEPGFVKAIAYVGSTAVCSHVVRTHGRAEAVFLSFDECGRPLAGDGVDAVFAHASIIDENGTLVPDSTATITFSLEGRGVIIGENPVNARGGIATVLLRGVSDILKIKASSHGLLTAGREIVLEKEKCCKY
ncbi:MAG: DUF4982 domain-containing protein [Victivallales bacterium]|nr:DUF4982 domain-containing protein [Victivallales bacterium]